MQVIWQSLELILGEGGVVSAGGLITIQGIPHFPATDRGLLRGTGVVHGNVLNLGVARPVFANIAGTLHIEGDYRQVNGDDKGKLLIDLSSLEEFGRLDVSGDVTLAGELRLQSPANLQLGDEFDILDWGGTLTGTFEGILSDDLSPELTWDISDLYVTGVVRVAPKFLADFTLDADVDNIDLALWRGGFGTTGNATHPQGDADGDLDVDGRDYLIWQREFGSDATPAVASGESVPEPGAWALWLTAAAMAWRRDELSSRSAPRRAASLARAR